MKRLVWFLCTLSVLLPASAAIAQAPSAGKASASSEAGRLDALTEAGIERYRAGSFREAIAILNSVVAGRADIPAAQLYLSLSYVKLGEDASAQRHLTALRGLSISPRLRAQVDIVLEGLSAGPVSPPLRQFIASALDETMSLERSPRRPSFVGTFLKRNFPYFP
ncbi:MAG: hypothetical protein ACRD1B_01385 [Thermoanaerobaculia bacterium]